MKYKKGEIKANILMAIDREYYTTVPAIEAETMYPKSTIKDTIRHLISERCIVKIRFKDEDLNPQEYRTSEQGRMPKYFYELKPAGEKKLRYFRDIGLV